MYLIFGLILSVYGQPPPTPRFVDVNGNPSTSDLIPYILSLPNPLWTGIWRATADNNHYYLGDSTLGMVTKLQAISGTLRSYPYDCHLKTTPEAISKCVMEEVQSLHFNMMANLLKDLVGFIASARIIDGNVAIGLEPMIKDIEDLVREMIDLTNQDKREDMIDKLKEIIDKMHRLMAIINDVTDLCDLNLDDLTTKMTEIANKAVEVYRHDCLEYSSQTMMILIFTFPQFTEENTELVVAKPNGAAFAPGWIKYSKDDGTVLHIDAYKDIQVIDRGAPRRRLEDEIPEINDDVDDKTSECCRPCVADFLYSLKCSKSPTTDPTKSPTTDPTKSPSTDPTISPSTDPTISPTTDPTSSRIGIHIMDCPAKYDDFLCTESNCDSCYGCNMERDDGSVCYMDNGICVMYSHDSPTIYDKCIKIPTSNPTIDPTKAPSTDPTTSPTADPTKAPSTDPTNSPSFDPTKTPTKAPIEIIAPSTCKLWGRYIDIIILNDISGPFKNVNGIGTANEFQKHQHMVANTLIRLKSVDNGGNELPEVRVAYIEYDNGVNVIIPINYNPYNGNNDGVDGTSLITNEQMMEYYNLIKERGDGVSDEYLQNQICTNNVNLFDALNEAKNQFNLQPKGSDKGRDRYIIIFNNCKVSDSQRYDICDEYEDYIRNGMDNADGGTNQNGKGINVVMINMDHQFGDDYILCLVEYDDKRIYQSNYRDEQEFDEDGLDGTIVNEICNNPTPSPTTDPTIDPTSDPTKQPTPKNSPNGAAVFVQNDNGVLNKLNNINNNDMWILMTIIVLIAMVFMNIICCTSCIKNKAINNKKIYNAVNMKEVDVEISDENIPIYH